MCVAPAPCWHTPGRVLAVLLGGSLLVGCGATAARPPGSTATRARSRAAIPPTLLAEARPIGNGTRFHPPAPRRVSGRCDRILGPREQVHVEVFAENRVVIVPAGIGVGGPWRLIAGRIAGARCYGGLVTLEPTGVVLVARGARLDLGDLFRAWRQSLSRTRIASFGTSTHDPVRVFVDGRRLAEPLGRVALRAHAEIVLELGPYVPPHSRFDFAPSP